MSAIRSYRVEFFDASDRQPCLFGRYPTRREAEQALQAEWERWCSLASRNAIRVTVSQLNGDQFVVRTRSGQASIVYRVESAAEQATG